MGCQMPGRGIIYYWTACQAGKAVMTLGSLEGSWLPSPFFSAQAGARGSLGGAEKTARLGQGLPAPCQTDLPSPPRAGRQEAGGQQMEELGRQAWKRLLQDEKTCLKQHIQRLGRTGVEMGGHLNGGRRRNYLPARHVSQTGRQAGKQLGWRGHHYYYWEEERAFCHHVWRDELTFGLLEGFCHSPCLPIPDEDARTWLMYY